MERLALVSISQNFARWYFFDVDEDTTVYSWERFVKMVKTMWKVLKTKALA